MKFCPNCGSQIPANANVCPNCGAPQQFQQAMPQQPMGGPMPYAARPVVQKREVATAIILSIVTCGIYAIIWMINLVDDVNRICNDEKSNQSGGTVFLLNIVTCGIYGIIWFYNAGDRMARAGQKYGIPIADNGTLYLLLCIFGLSIVDYCMVQSDLNKFSNQQ